MHSFVTDVEFEAALSNSLQHFFISLVWNVSRSCAWKLWRRSAIFSEFYRLVSGSLIFQYLPYLLTWRDSCDCEIRSRVLVLISGELCFEIEKSVVVVYFAVIDLSRISPHEWKEKKTRQEIVMQREWLVVVTAILTFKERPWEPLSVFTSVHDQKPCKPDAISSELPYRPNHVNTVATTDSGKQYPWYCCLCTELTKSITFGAKFDGLARKGERYTVVSASFSILASPVRGKNLQCGNEWSFQWSSKRSNFDKFASHRWNGGKKWDFRLLARDAATLTRKYKACSSPAKLKQVWLSNRWKPWKSSKDVYWSSAKNEASVSPHCIHLNKSIVVITLSKHVSQWV